jgi:HK97 gp10 family phage protein
MPMPILRLNRLKRKLAQLPREVTKGIRLALEESANEIVALAKSLVPEDSGALRDSIGWTWGQPPKGSMVLLKTRASLKLDLTLTIYAGNDEAYYARWVEFATKSHVNRGLFAGSQHPGTAAQPFFYPAYRANRKPAKAKIRRAVRKAVKTIASK